MARAKSWTDLIDQFDGIRYQMGDSAAAVGGIQPSFQYSQKDLPRLKKANKALSRYLKNIQRHFGVKKVNYWSFEEPWANQKVPQSVYMAQANG